MDEGLGVLVAGLAVVGLLCVGGVGGEAVAFGAVEGYGGGGAIRRSAGTGGGRRSVESGAGEVVEVFIQDGGGGGVGQDGVREVHCGLSDDGVLSEAGRVGGAGTGN